MKIKFIFDKNLFVFINSLQYCQLTLKNSRKIRFIQNR